MRWLRTVVRELYGLFVDDGRFALTVVIWLCVCWLILPRVAASTFWPGMLLFAGLAAILVESASRRARK
jgi:hypothetical protein